MPVGGYTSGGGGYNSGSGYNYAATSQTYTTDNTVLPTYPYVYKCGHTCQFPVNMAAPVACPTCEQDVRKHTLHNAMSYHQLNAQLQHQKKEEHWNQVRRAKEMLGAMSPPKELTAREWLDGEVLSVCQLAFA